MSKVEKTLSIVCAVIAILAVNYLLYLAGEPRAVWFMNLLGIGK